MSVNRRHFLYLLGASVGGVTLGACQASGDNLSAVNGSTTVAESTGTFELPSLPYAYDALEPYIDAETMRFHHDKHHAGYTRNLNKALEKHPELKGKTGEQLLETIASVPDDIRRTVRNNGGGYVNHKMFWEIMSPDGGGEPTGEIASAIAQTFGSFAAFQKQFNEAGSKRFGSGWAWLVYTPNGNLKVMNTANQDSPLMEGNYPIMGNDVWEHAYYLKYRNDRGAYLKAWWNVVNWDEVNRRFSQARTA